MPRALPLVLGVSLLACTNSHGWSKAAVARHTEECVKYHRERPDLPGLVQQARDLGYDLSPQDEAQLRDAPFDEAMIQRGCACTYQALSERVRLADFAKDEELRRREYGRARDACVGRSPAQAKLAPRPAAKDARVTCPESSAQRSQTAMGETRIWCEDDAGFRHGPERRYYTGGQLAEERAWTHGVRDGVSRRFHQDGRPAREARYRAGALEGRSASWYENGTLEHEVEWRDDEAVGTQRWWEYDGTPRSVVDEEQPDPKAKEEFAPAEGEGEFGFESKGLALALTAAGTLRDRGSETGAVSLPVGGAAVTGVSYTATTTAPVRNDPVLVVTVQGKDGRRTGLVVRVHALWREDGQEVNHVVLDGLRWTRALPFAPTGAVAWGRFLYVGGTGAAARIDLLDGKLSWAATGLGAAPLAAASYADGRVVLRGASPQGAGAGTPPVEVALDDRTGTAPGAALAKPAKASRSASDAGPARKKAGPARKKK